MDGNLYKNFCDTIATVINNLPKITDTTIPIPTLKIVPTFFKNNILFTFSLNSLGPGLYLFKKMIYFFVSVSFSKLHNHHWLL